ncbi:MAG: hypothetical protein JNK85_26280 [Verrucomicrobiales bacterium]|nr:hypothetical protein [Verrucomicrobiales bacterium]
MTSPLSLRAKDDSNSFLDRTTALELEPAKTGFSKDFSIPYPSKVCGAAPAAVLEVQEEQHSLPPRRRPTFTDHPSRQRR